LLPGYAFIRFKEYEVQNKVLLTRHMIMDRWCDVKVTVIQTFFFVADEKAKLARAGNTNLEIGLSTVDLLALTSSAAFNNENVVLLIRNKLP